MKQPRTRHVTLALGVAVAAVGLVVTSLLLPLLVAAAAGSSVWLVAAAWASDPVPGSVPPAPVSLLGIPPVSDADRLLATLRTARLLPAHAVDDTECLDELLAGPRPRTAREVEALTARAAQAVGL